MILATHSANFDTKFNGVHIFWFMVLVLRILRIIIDYSKFGINRHRYIFYVIFKKNLLFLKIVLFLCCCIYPLKKKHVSVFVLWCVSFFWWPTKQRGKTMKSSNNSKTRLWNVLIFRSYVGYILLINCFNLRKVSCGMSWFTLVFSDHYNWCPKYYHQWTV